MRPDRPHVFATALAFCLLLLTPVAAFAQITVDETSIRAGTVHTFTGPAELPGSEYLWEFETGAPRRASTRAVDWTAPEAVPSNPSHYTVTLKFTAAGGTDTYTKGIHIFNRVYIDGKEDLAQIVLPDHELILDAAGGDFTTYTWSVQGPNDPAPSIEQQGKQYTFTAPSTGLFSGAYTITATDSIGGEGGTDRHVVYVPPVIDTPDHAMMEGGPTTTFTVMGAPVGAIYTVTLWDKVDGTGTELSATPSTHGQVDPLTVVGNDGRGSVNYTPPANVDENLQFWVVFETYNKELLVDGYNIYKPRPMGRIGVLNGVATGATLWSQGSPLPGADVRLIYPHSMEAATQSNAQGNFAFVLPDTGTYCFQASHPGYVAKRFTTRDIENATVPGVIELEAADPTAHVTGQVTASINGNPVALTRTVTVALCHGDADGDHVNAGEIKTADGQFRIDLPAHPGWPTYTIVAYMPEYRASTVIQGPLPVTNVSLDMTQNPTHHNRVFTSTLLGLEATAMTDDLTLGGYGEFPAGSVDEEMLEARSDDNMTIERGAKWRTDQEEIVEGSPIVVALSMFETNNPHHDHDFLEGKAIITVPIDLGEVRINDLEDKRQYLRKAPSLTHLLFDLQTEVVPPEDILGTDYVGDGDRGWVTARVESLSSFGVGATEPETGDTSNFPFTGYKEYPPYDAPGGCFVDPSPGPENRGALPLAAFFVLCAALALAVRGLGGRHR
ncbi:MAG: hypothetical protein ACLFOY_10345 [Desulfatibacillaceae bacterium]